MSNELAELMQCRIEKVSLEEKVKAINKQKEQFDKRMAEVREQMILNIDLTKFTWESEHPTWRISDLLNYDFDLMSKESAWGNLEEPNHWGERKLTDHVILRLRDKGKLLLRGKIRHLCQFAKDRKLNVDFTGFRQTFRDRIAETEAELKLHLENAIKLQEFLKEIA